MQIIVYNPQTVWQRSMIIVAYPHQYLLAVGADISYCYQRTIQLNLDSGLSDMMRYLTGATEGRNTPDCALPRRPPTR